MWWAGGGGSSSRLPAYEAGKLSDCYRSLFKWCARSDSNRHVTKTLHFEGSAYSSSATSANRILKMVRPAGVEPACR